MCVDLGSQLCLDEFLVPFLLDFIFDLVFQLGPPLMLSCISIFSCFFLERFSVGVIVERFCSFFIIGFLLNCAIQDDRGRNYRSGFFFFIRDERNASGGKRARVC